jgi:hypothetical protein
MVDIPKKAEVNIQRADTNNFTASDVAFWHDDKLLAQANYFRILDIRRASAASHDKFNKPKRQGRIRIPKMNFPPANAQYLKLKNIVETEMKKRKLELKNENLY